MWTVAGYEKSELAIARKVAHRCGDEFNPIINEPGRIFDWERTAAIENNGFTQHHLNILLLLECRFCL